MTQKTEIIEVEQWCFLDISMRGGEGVKSNKLNQISAVSATDTYKCLIRIVTSVSLFSLASSCLPATAVSDSSTRTTTLLLLFGTCYASRDLLMRGMGCQITSQGEYKSADGLKQLLCIILHACCEVLCASLRLRSQKNPFSAQQPRESLL